MKPTFFFQIIFIIALFSSCTKHEKPKKEPSKKVEFTYKQVPIAGNAYLRFYEFDENSLLYSKPKLIINSQKFPIKGLDKKYENFGEIKTVSPNGNYFILDLMTINTQKKVEEIGCIIIDIPNKMVVKKLINTCNGEWNKANQWLVNGKVIVSFD